VLRGLARAVVHTLRAPQLASGPVLGFDITAAYTNHRGELLYTEYCLAKAGAVSKARPFRIPVVDAVPGAWQLKVPPIILDPTPPDMCEAHCIATPTMSSNDGLNTNALAAAGARLADEAAQARGAAKLAARAERDRSRSMSADSAASVPRQPRAESPSKRACRELLPAGKKEHVFSGAGAAASAATSSSCAAAKPSALPAVPLMPKYAEPQHPPPMPPPQMSSSDRLSLAQEVANIVAMQLNPQLSNINNNMHNLRSFGAR
jgi:hypothetical protein